MRHLVFSIMVLLLALPFGCPSNNSPSTPPPVNTPTFTNTPCMNASQTPCTSTPTFTYTFTPTNTGTFTPCPSTPTPTNTTLTSYSLSSSVTYTGSVGTVDASHPILVALYNNPDANFKHGPWAPPASVTTNPGTYTAYLPNSAYAWYILVVYNSLGSSSNVNFTSPNNGIPVGAPYFIYGGGSNGCSSPATVGYAVGTALAGPIISFGDTCLMPGIYGTASYSGSKGLVNSCQQIFVKAYSDSGYTMPVSVGGGPVYGMVSANGSRYDASDIGDNASNTYYWMAWFDSTSTVSSGGCATGSSDASPCPHLGDPYSQLGSHSAAYNNVPVSFDDTFHY